MSVICSYARNLFLVIIENKQFPHSHKKLPINIIYRLSPWYAGARAKGFLMPSHIWPDSSTLDAPSVTMALRAHPTIPSNLTPKSNTGILRPLSLGNLTLTLKYWITKSSTLLTFTQDHQEAGCNVLYFTMFSSEAAWTHAASDENRLK